MNKETYRFREINPYNVIAELLIHIRSLNARAFADEAYRLSIKETPGVHEDVEAVLAQIPSFANGETVCRYGIQADAVTQLHKWEHYDSFQHMLEFLRCLTRQLTEDRMLDSDFFQYIACNGFSGLNDNETKTGIHILPAFKTINDFTYTAGEKKYAFEHLSGVNSELSNIYYVEDKELCINGVPCTATHYILDERSFWQNRKTLKIGFSPVYYGDFLVSERFLTSGEQGETIGRFSVKSLKHEELLESRVRAAYLEACVRGVDILIFPEMLGNARMVGRDFIKALRREAKNPAPVLTLMPSWWHERSNTVYLKAGSGRDICVQNKIVPFLLEGDDGQNYAEDLAPEPVHIQILHLPAIGRIAVMICRDLLETKMTEIVVQQLRATFLLSPSYSKHKTQFDQVVPTQNCFGCYTVWLNTCASLYEKDKPFDRECHIGVVSGPQEINQPPVLLCPSCTDCGTPEQPCLFLVEISSAQFAVISQAEHYYPNYQAK